MRPASHRRLSSEATDEVGLIVALLVRYPALATIVSHPSDGTMTLSFAVTGPLDRNAARAVREGVSDHVRSLLELGRERPGALTVVAENDPKLSFVRVTRDARSFSRDELELLVALLADRFGERLIKSPAPDDDGIEEDRSDDLVEYAIDALRDPAQKRSLVGFREEKRVLVYFVPSRKKAKARARS